MIILGRCCYAYLKMVGNAWDVELVDQVIGVGLMVVQLVGILLCI
jgi:hypothetical protein